MPKSRSIEDRRAREVARLLTALRPLDGVAWVDRGRYALIDFDGFSSIRPEALTAALFEPRLPAMAGPLGGTRVEVSEETLTEWAKALAELAATPDLAKLIKSGTRPLRRWRGISISGELSRLSARLRAVARTARRARRFADAWEAADAPDALVELLPLRVHALGGWDPDPLVHLADASAPAGDALRRAQTSPDPLVAAVAGVLLERRRGAGPPGITPVLEARARLAGVGCPTAPAVPPADLARLAVVAERLAALFGVPFALRAHRHLAAAYACRTDTRRDFRPFHLAAGAVDREWVTFAIHTDERALQQMLADIPGKALPRADRLAEVFLDWVGVKNKKKLRPTLRGVARAAIRRGPGAAAIEIVRTWEALHPREAVKPEVLHTRLAFALRVPDWPGEIPFQLGVYELDRLANACAGRTATALTRIVRLGEAAGRDSPYAWSHLADVVEAELSENPARRILRRHRGYIARRFARCPDRLGRYLDLLDALDRRPVPGLDPDSDWLMDMFASGRSWAGTAAMVVLRHARARAPGEAAAVFHQLSRALAGHGRLEEYHRTFIDALTAWDTPTVEAAPPETADLIRALGLTPAEADRYLHLRRLAGYGETFAAGLTDVLTTGAREAEEVAALRRLAADPARPDHDRLLARLSRLLDPARAAARRAADRARGRTRFARSLAVLEQESLTVVTDRVCRRFLEERLGRALPPGPLPAGVWEALALLHAHSINRPLLTDFLDDVLSRRPLASRPPNAAWLARAATAGVDVAAWQAGFRATVRVGDEEITFATETDPLHVLKMGTYFDTCLSLDTGSNAASTLVNALDVNKHVVYGRRADGAVVVRKLVGATARGEFTGYRTYAGVNHQAVRDALVPLLLRFAARCGLRPCDAVRPEVLHGGFWYNDGNEPWPTP
jgi:hypothetical protein